VKTKKKKTKKVNILTIDKKKKEEALNKIKKKNYYFTIETQEKIEEYQNASRKKTKHSLYREFIHPAFEDLVHNLISVYKFRSSNEEISHLKSDCVTFLYETIPKWKPEKGTKAFSYFNVVAKNWLTIHSRRLLKNAKRNVSLDNITDFTQEEKRQLSDLEYDESNHLILRKEMLTKNIDNIVVEIKTKLKDNRDIRCIEAVREIFLKADELDYLNKRAVFVYLREISGLNSTELSSSLSTIRKHFKKINGTKEEFDLFF
jgi:hypothetical protein